MNIPAKRRIIMCMRAESLASRLGSVMVLLIMDLEFVSYLIGALRRQKVTSYRDLIDAWNKPADAIGVGGVFRMHLLQMMLFVARFKVEKDHD